MSTMSSELKQNLAITLNEKMDTILALQKKQKRSTIAEVSSKVGNLLEVIEKKQKVEYI